MIDTLNALVIHPQDSVAVALRDLQPGDEVRHGDKPVLVAEAIPTGHKVALAEIAAGRPVLKYGMPIGHATQPIAAGAWVHTHNLATNLSGVDAYVYEPALDNPTCVESSLTFQGYRRANGEVGIRNDIWIIPTVGCVNSVAEQLAQRALEGAAAVDAIVAFPHPYGCSQLGDDHRQTQQILANLAHHPNAGGVLIVGLGCENNHIATFKTVLGDYDPARVAFLNCQDVEDEFAEGERLLQRLLAHAATAVREPIPISALRVGLKCGGSDAFSGITANPLVGRFSDCLTACGGTTILTEVPEMFGAEGPLLNRCVSPEVFERGVAMVNDFKDYYHRHGQVIYENPSPGNKAGGISTLEEKSLGCTQKSGSAPVVDVLDYGERVRRAGVNLLSGPGNDIVATTALAAAGAHLVLFTTGRGTPLGSPVPVVKIASNSALAEHKRRWIDIDAGPLLTGAKPEVLDDLFFSAVLAVASGTEQTRNERYGFREIAIMKDGVTL